MASNHYTSIPIILSKEDVGDLIELDTDHITTAHPKPLQTLVYLNTHIISQLTDFCVQHHIESHLPLSITVTPMLPLTREDA